jgi:hypothetical protein
MTPVQREFLRKPSDYPEGLKNRAPLPKWEGFPARLSRDCTGSDPVDKPSLPLTIGTSTLLSRSLSPSDQRRLAMRTSFEQSHNEDVHKPTNASTGKQGQTMCQSRKTPQSEVAGEQ